MRTRWLNCLAIGLVALLALSRDARAEITVMISGGFALAYQEWLARKWCRRKGCRK